MRVLLIEPSFHLRSGEMYRTTHGMSIVPLTLPYVAAQLPSGWAKTLVYEKAQPVPWEDEYDLVLISALHSEATRADEIAAWFTSRGIPVVLGGYYPTLSPDDALRHASTIVIGEVEDTMPMILADISAGQKLKPIYRSTNTQTLSHLHHPLWDRVSADVLRPTSMLSFQATRGCTRNCEFCCQRQAYGRNFRRRPVREVIDELSVLPSRRWFQTDENPTLDRDYCKRLFVEVAKTCRPKTWILQAGADIVDDTELLDLAAKAGVTAMLIGLETLHHIQSVKGFGSKRLYELLAKRLRSRKITLIASIIFGFDTDTPETFGTTLNWLERQRVPIVFPWILTPVVGSALVDRLAAEHRLPYGRDIYVMPEGACGTRATFTPLRMSGQELEDGFWKFFRDFYSWRSICKRFWRNPMSPELLANYAFRRLVRQGMHPMLVL